jgi:hypothetical protein
MHSSARFQMRIRCPQARRGARAKLVFRAPFRRTFSLENGAGTVRVEVDQPRGDELPLGWLTTRPRDADCRGVRSRLRRGLRRFTAASLVYSTQSKG